MYKRNKKGIRALNKLKQLRNLAVSFLAIIALLFIVQPQAHATASKTYTVTANLFVPGNLNTQLPGVTAYLTNGSNPLGIGGYPAVAPTKPVSKNAKLTVYSDGTMKVDLKVPNPVFTLQKISGSSNASILSAPRDSAVYESVDGSASRQGRITDISVKLHDKSGKYVFNDCIEFPTLLGVNWTVPLTLAVDFSGVDFNVAEEKPVEKEKTPAKANDGVKKPVVEKVNYDNLKAIIQTVNKDLRNALVSKDGKDVEPSKVWTTEAELKTLKDKLQQAENKLKATSQQAVDNATSELMTTYKKFLAVQKSGTMLESDEEANKNRELAPGTYTISANIWFNKVDSGLPLNPHITNSTFPPYNPVANNAKLVIAKDGTATVTIPVVIQDKVMTIRHLEGLKLLDVQKLDNGAISEITVDLGKLSGERTVITQKIHADIEMGDLAMSISGLTKEHSWPATFELNLSGVATKDGDVMPTVELQMLNNDEASGVMALAGVASDTAVEKEADSMAEKVVDENPAQDSKSSLWIIVITIGAVIAASVGVWLTKRKKLTTK